jgi:hypothetical protein
MLGCWGGEMGNRKGWDGMMGWDRKVWGYIILYLYLYDMREREREREREEIRFPSHCEQVPAQLIFWNRIESLGFSFYLKMKMKIVCLFWGRDVFLEL